MAVPVLVVVLALAGVVLVWSATHGANVTSTMRDLLAGKAAQAGGQ